jgi:hypothetical protein
MNPAIKHSLEYRKYKDAGNKAGRWFSNKGNTCSLKERGEELLELIKKTNTSFHPFVKVLFNQCIIRWSESVGDLRNQFTRETCKKLVPVIDVFFPIISLDRISDNDEVQKQAEEFYPAVEELKLDPELVDGFIEGFVEGVTRNHPTIQQGAFNIICQFYRYWGDEEVNKVFDEVMNQNGVYTPMI